MKKNVKILLIEDEEKLQHVIRLNLLLEGYLVDTVSKAPNILDILKKSYYDLIILDIMLPEKDGFTICELVRGQDIDVKILMLSARSSSLDRSLGLKKGADDYMVKPFELSELLFRVKRLIDMVRYVKQENSILRFGHNVVNLDLLEATNFEKKKIRLTKKEALLLKLLVQNENLTQRREKILNQIWEYNYLTKNRTLDNCILKFRKYFEINPKEPKHFISKRGIGYVFIN